MVSSRLPSVAMMRGGVVDVNPFLISRNTLGNGKTTTQNLKDKSQMVVAGMRWWFCGSSMGLRKCNDGFQVRNAKVEGKVVDYTRCRSWKHGP